MIGHLRTTGRRRSLGLLVIAVVAALLVTACGGGDDDGASGDDGTTTDSTTDGGAASDALIIVADTVSGPLNIPDDQRAGAVCVLQSQFPRNSEIVWRARVVDGTGAALDDQAVESVTVELADGQTLDMRYGGHPSSDPVDFFWTTSFDIPDDYPTGTLNYTITATGMDGATGSFEPFPVEASLLTVTDDVLETIEEEES